ncbi:MAG: septum formation protein Maf [Gammaproteobacteria bacterium]|nr:septum formation protein Maf [Gammaproteobacteria bacterium]
MLGSDLGHRGRIIGIGPHPVKDSRPPFPVPKSLICKSPFAGLSEHQVNAPELILASTSESRRALMERLRIPFRIAAPGIAEASIPGESPGQMAGRLATAKARAIATTSTADVIVIGSDQVPASNGATLGKPGTHERAVDQLQSVSGRWVRFHTGVSVQRPATGFSSTLVETYDLRFRQLGAPLIERYLNAERPYHCAGSLKVEGLGILLLEAARGNDQTTVLGLPLMSLTRLLRDAGLDPDLMFE